MQTDVGTVKVKKGDRDCSSAVCEAWELALAGTQYDGLITRYNWTGGMREMFLGSGLFSWQPVSFAAQRGDVWLDESTHTAMCMGGGKIAHFSGSETGGIDGAPGDQTGRESRIQDWYRGSWDGVLHYNGKAGGGGGSSSVPSGSVTELAQRVIAGEFGNGDARKAALGSRYDEVQAEVNRILGGGSVDIDALARRVIAGEFGNGDARRQALGSNYSAVQSRVNEILAGTGATSTSVDIDAMARAVIRGDYGNGKERKQRLGSYYSIVQRRVNEILP